MIDCSRADVTCPSEVWPRELQLAPRAPDEPARPLRPGAQTVEVQGAQVVRWINGQGTGACALKAGSIITAEVMSVASAEALRPSAVALTSGYINAVLAADCIASPSGLPKGAEVTLTTGFSAVKR